MPTKKGLIAAIVEKLDIPREAMPGGFGLTLSGQRELTVRGCRKILHYGEREIRLRVGKTVLRILGESLLCASFGAGGVTVTGEIRTLCFGEEVL